MGADPDKCYTYRFTSLHETDILKEPVCINEKEELRKKLNITEPKVILGVGQFIHRKGWDMLMKAAVAINRDIGVYIVGGKTPPEYENLKSTLKLNNVHFVDFKVKDELSEYYKAADLFVLPTREDIWGLVINEAMAHGLPVITTDRCIAGLELIEDGESGYIVPSDDAVNLSNRIGSVLSDEKLRDKMSRKSLKKIREYTIEEMVRRHMSVLKRENEFFSNHGNMGQHWRHNKLAYTKRKVY